MALVIVMALSVELQPESLAVMVEGFVPPPVEVSGGENDTLADTAQVAQPCAAPENLGGLVVAVTGVAKLTSRPAASAKAPVASVNRRFCIVATSSAQRPLA